MKNKQKDTKVLWKGQFLKEERPWASRWPGRERGEKVPRGVDDSWDEAVRAETMGRRYTREAHVQPRCLNGVGLGDREVFRMRPNGLPLTLGGQMVEDAEVSRGHGGCEESTGQLGGARAQWPSQRQNWDLGVACSGTDVKG